METRLQTKSTLICWERCKKREDVGILDVSLCEMCQRQSCKAFVGLTISAKMICGTVGATPSTPEMLRQSDRVGAKSPIFDPFSRAGFSQ